MTNAAIILAAIGAPAVNPIVDARFDDADILADIFGEFADERLRSSDENQIAHAEAHIVVLHKGRPVSDQAIFKSGAQRPAASRLARKGVKATIKWCWIFISRMLPGIATEDIEERPIERGAGAPSDCPNGFDSGHAGLSYARSRKAGILHAVKVCQIRVGFDAEHGPAGLIIESDLTAAQDAGGANGSILETGRLGAPPIRFGLDLRTNRI